AGDAVVTALSTVRRTGVQVDALAAAHVVVLRADAFSGVAGFLRLAGEAALPAVGGVCVRVDADAIADVVLRRADAAARGAHVVGRAGDPAAPAVPPVGVQAHAPPVADILARRADAPALAAVGGVALEVQAAQAFAATRLQAGRASAVPGEGITGRDRADGQRHGPPLNLDAVHLVGSHIDPRDDALQPGRIP